jgi:hypothetical protein
MIVVADTTPIRHLVAIHRIELIPLLYGELLIAEAVMQELLAESTPPAVKAWMQKGADWLLVAAPSKSQALEPDLLEPDPGEIDAIRLAEERNADLILIDDRMGREAAMRRGLRVAGTVGILEEADRLGLIPDFERALAGLEESRFYLSKSFRELVLPRFRERRSKK